MRGRERITTRSTRASKSLHSFDQDESLQYYSTRGAKHAAHVRTRSRTPSNAHLTQKAGRWRFSLSQPGQSLTPRNAAVYTKICSRFKSAARQRCTHRTQLRFSNPTIVLRLRSRQRFQCPRAQQLTHKRRDRDAPDPCSVRLSTVNYMTKTARFSPLSLSPCPPWQQNLLLSPTKPCRQCTHVGLPYHPSARPPARPTAVSRMSKPRCRLPPSNPSHRRHPPSLLRVVRPACLPRSRSPRPSHRLLEGGGRGDRTGQTAG